MTPLTNSIEETVRKWATALYLKYEPEELPPNLGIATPSIDLENAITNLTQSIITKVKESLPEKETPIETKKAIGDHPGIDQFNDYANGYNQAIDDMRSKL
jgi:hypothetical protein